jgi:acetate kinase
MLKRILVLNAGSSSLKFAVFNQDDLSLHLRGQVEGIGNQPILMSGSTRIELSKSLSMGEGLATVLEWLEEHNIVPSNLAGFGHRIVHGGSQFISPTIINDRVLSLLEKLRKLAPLHLPFGLSVMRDCRALRPHLPHVACFDTAFHATQSELSTRLPLPRTYFDKGYKRYGFHGLNYEHVVHEMPVLTGKPLPKRLLVAHLGSGASMCAILNGKSVATTMGFSTADGLMMGTRTGSIDPGVLIALLRDEKLTVLELEDLLYRKSGLLGMSGISSDMRVLLQSTAPEAAEAIDYYCLSAARHAASLVPTMGGVDAMVFTGGVGENASAIRQKIMSHLAVFHIPADAVHILPANEELTMARHVAHLLKQRH